MSYFTHEQRYRDLAPIVDRPITICGAGALGANFAETLARMGMRRLRAIDRDRVEAHNLSTQPWTQQDVGAPKARVLANALYRAVGARVDAQHAELGAANALELLEGSAVIVDAFDNLASRAIVGRTAKALGIPCLHIALGMEGDYGCGLWDGAYNTNDERGTMNDEGQNAESSLTNHRSSFRDTCDYPLTRPLALLVAAAAAEVLVSHLLDGSRRGFELTLRDLRLTSR